MKIVLPTMSSETAKKRKMDGGGGGEDGSCRGAVVATVVKFNVGGKHFEVSRALIDEQNSDTMLGRLVSDTWSNDPSKPVFIDRNGDIFSHLLDYLRYGRWVIFICEIAMLDWLILALI